MNQDTSKYAETDLGQKRTLETANLELEKQPKKQKTGEEAPVVKLSDAPAAIGSISNDNRRSSSKLQPFKPLEQWNIEEVQQWMQTFKDGKFKEIAKHFDILDGSDLGKMTEEQFIRFAKDERVGTLLFNDVQILEKDDR